MRLMSIFGLRLLIFWIPGNLGAGRCAMFLTSAVLGRALSASAWGTQEKTHTKSSSSDRYERTLFNIVCA